jgi:PUA domain protein
VPAFRRLKDKEVKGLLRDLNRTYPSTGSLRSANNFDELSIGEHAVYFIDGAPLIVRSKIGLMPSLKYDEAISSLPHIVVDMGAVAHVANGANIMRPGVRRIDGDFGKGELVVIVDEKYSKPIAIGRSEVDSTEMRLIGKGQVVENVHYVGDELWRSFVRPS